MTFKFHKIIFFPEKNVCAYKVPKNLFLIVVTCHLLITFANSLDPDQDRQNVGPDLDRNGLTL